MSKKIKITIMLSVITVVAIIFIIIISVINQINDVASTFNAKSNHGENITVETHDVNEFFNKTYLGYNGGKDAENFFDEYANFDQYKDIAFHYKDGENDTYPFELHRRYYQHTIFVLDVYYEEELFLKISDQILLELTGQNAENVFNLYEQEKNKSFVGYKIKKDDDIYKNNNAAIFFDPRYHTIRYAFLCNNTGSEDDVRQAASKVLCVSENYNEKDWVFNYSDIIID